ncbi:sulfite exporter TauE/SafE family protein [Reinekea blandensis]|uniref:Probable membrane transporter protein n=1 Tax=Reinekea blandensis MED297 TaxID=314283 RepID=A4BK63_9GAMM|nr:sulfite exporter TauE/SafE family protein [Reinekea blandensis]EAR07492.1 hypothetical protein MED297_09636 [Reinekea sp. MED297] [Reinekea blandensis MED297]
MELTVWFVVLLATTGFIAGIINTLAGGGSNLTLPALMMMGLPADVANATNRVGVFMQSLVGLKGFHGHGELPLQDARGILIPTLVGGLVGAAIASWMPTTLLKPILLITMISMSVVILLKPATVIPQAGEQPYRVQERRRAAAMLFLAGVYGGFVQAGVGFVLIAAIAGGLRYDLVKTNALKILCTMAFTAVALGLFIVRGQVSWVPGLILAMATMAGAQVGVRLALNVSQRFMKWFLLLMTVAASIGAML